MLHLYVLLGEVAHGSQLSLFIAGALGKQVEDSTIANQQPAKEGGAIKRKKPTSLGVLIEAGVIEDGAVLRYMKVLHLDFFWPPTWLLGPWPVLHVV